MTVDSGSGAHETTSGPEPRRVETVETVETEAAVVPRTRPQPPPQPDVDVSVGDQRRDPVRWGSVWAGVLVALTTFLLVELLFFAFGWLTYAQGNPSTTAGWISGLIGLFAFFMGGLVAGATSIWRGVREGMVHGVLVWALGLVGIIFITLFGGGSLFGSVANVFGQFASLQQAALPDVQVSEVTDTVRSAARWAVLALALSLAAAVLGGMAGVKMGSKYKD